MKIRGLLIVALVIVVALAIPAAAGKKKPAQRGMLEKMEAVPCGAGQKGVTGLGSLWASVGVEHVTSDEKLCPQYLFRTDDMEYHIRPLDKKHPVILPIGHEGEYKISKDRMYLKVPDGDRKKRAYQVVAMKPLNAEGDHDKSTEASRQ